MKPIEQGLVDHFSSVDDVLNLRERFRHRDDDRYGPDPIRDLLNDVDWLAVANAVAAKKEPIFNGEQISLSDSFVGYNGDSEVEMISYNPDDDAFSIYDTVIDENTPIELIERILESGALMLQYEPYVGGFYGDDYCGSRMYREPNGEYTVIAFDDTEEWHLITRENIEEVWDWFRIASKNIRVVDAPQPGAGMFESVDLDALTYNEIGALLERGALHVDDTDDWLAKTLYRVGDGEYAIVFEPKDGTLRIDPEDNGCTLKHAVKELKVVIEDRDVYLIPTE